MRRAFVIRHGNTFASSAEARRVGARTDIPLVESGHAQARALADWFAVQALPVRRLLVSPLLRARQTAAPVAAALGLPSPREAGWLAEIDHGPDENRPEAEVLARIGALALADWEERGIAPDGWTVDGDARLAAWRAFFAEPGEGVDLLFTSNGAARYALMALERPPAKLRTGAFGELTIADGNARVERWDVRPEKP
ncbi:putative phosphoglycerate mutase [Sphingobium sp. OAS761]|uniref:histidine phosphatase family protein n=1 Tax=Sphingobium sp. OAS761 TaxID=2817901 RepID=UPI0020A1CE95|nr:histidine phosphatase family protein [Sphingobium sp. OAS761]MCP1468352.1 putative phosphoglycerate mutase [Sphingobium sp. OAS761]